MKPTGAGEGGRMAGSTAPLAWFLCWLAMAAALVAGIQPSREGETIAGAAALSRGVLAGQDTIGHDYPAAWWGWHQVRTTGRIPLWNPCWFGGEPFIASQTFLPFYPPNWLMAIPPMPRGFNLQYPLHLLLAAGAMGWTCRRRGFGWWAAGLAGLSWGFGGHLATLAGAGHIQKLQALAWMPLVVYGLGQSGAPPPRRGLMPLALGLSLQILAGHPQVVYMSLLAGGLEFSFRISDFGFRNYRLRCRLNRGEIEPWRIHSEIRNPKSEIALRLLSATQAIVLAMLLSAVLWVPTIEFGRQSNRKTELAWTDAVRGSLPPEEAFEFALPRLLGDSMPHGRGPYVGRYGASPTSAPERIVSDYVGAGTLLFALLALIFPGRRRAAAAGWLLLAALGLTLSLGGYLGPTYQLFLNVVPGLAYFRSPSTMMALLAFGLTMAAASGIEWFSCGPRLSVALRRALLIGLSAAIALCILYLFWRWRWHARDDQNRLFYLSAGHMAMTFGCIAACAALAIALAQSEYHDPNIRATRLQALAVIPIVWMADLALNAVPFWNAVDARPYETFMRNHWAMPAWDADAAQLQGPVRYLEVGGELKNWALTYTDYERGRVVGTAHGYHPLAYADYFRILDNLGFTNPAFLELFAVRWLVWPASADVAGMPRPPGFIEVARTGAQTLLHNPDNRFVRPAPTGAITEIVDWDAMLAWLRDPQNDPFPATSSIVYRAFPIGPGEWEIECAPDRPGAIFVSLPADAGWRASVRPADDSPETPIPIRKAFDYFIRLDVPGPEPADLSLRYDPISQRLGLYLTLWGLFWVGRKMRNAECGMRKETGKAGDRRP